MQLSKKFVCISYPQVDFLIPGDNVISAVSVKDLELSMLHNQKAEIFDFDEVGLAFTQKHRDSNIKTMIVLRAGDEKHLSLVTAQECKMCSIGLKDFSLFSDYYAESLKKFGVFACLFKNNRIGFLLDIKKTIEFMDNRFLEEL